MIGLTHQPHVAKLLRDKCSGVYTEMVDGAWAVGRPTLCRNMEEVVETSRSRYHWMLAIDLTIALDWPELLLDVQTWLAAFRGRVAIGIRPDGDHTETADRALAFERAGGQVYSLASLTDDLSWRLLWTRNQFKADKTIIQNALLDEIERLGKVLYHEDLFLALLDISTKTSNATQAAMLMFKNKQVKTKGAARQRLYQKIAAANALPPHMLLCMFRFLWQAWFIKHNRPVEEIEAFLGYDEESDAFIRHLNRTLKCDIDELLAVNYDRVLSWVAVQITRPWTHIPDKDVLFLTLPGFERRRVAIGGCEYSERCQLPTIPCVTHAALARKDWAEPAESPATVVEEHALPVPEEACRLRKRRPTGKFRAVTPEPGSRNGGSSGYLATGTDGW